MKWCIDLADIGKLPHLTLEEAGLC
jgi:hypothetical protein